MSPPEARRAKRQLRRPCGMSGKYSKGVGVHSLKGVVREVAGM
jgi:hypothetical protein